MQITPVSARLAGRPGQHFQCRFRLSNPSQTTPTAVSLEICDVTQAGPAHGYPQPGSTSYSCATWIAEIPSALELAPGEVFDLVMTGTVPVGISGTRHCALLITPRRAAGSTASAATGTTIGLSLAVPIDLSLPGPDLADVEVGDIQLVPAAAIAGSAPDAKESAGRLALVADLRNAGCGAAWLSGHAYLRDARTRRVVQHMAFGDQELLRVLPESHSELRMVLSSPVEAGEYLIEVQARYGRRSRRLQATRTYRVVGNEVAATMGTVRALSERYFVTVRPPRLEAPLSSTTETMRTLLVRNDEDVPLLCTAAMTTFTEETDGTVVESQEAPGAALSLSPAQFEIPARGSMGVRLSIRPGQGLDPTREHYWMLKVTGRAKEPAEQSSVAMGGTLIVAVDKRRAMPAVLKVTNVEVAQGLETTTFRMTLRNTGGSQVPVKGRLTIFDGQGGPELGSKILGEEESVAILAGSERLVETGFDMPMKDTPWLCELQMSLGRGNQTTLTFEVAPAKM